MWEVWLLIIFILFLKWFFSRLKESDRKDNSFFGNKSFEVKIPRHSENISHSHWEKLDTPIKRKTTIDKHGYKRNGYGRLIHRDKAEKLIYNKEDFDLEFGEYVVHHKDGNKLNNRKDNLEILTQEEHKKKHGIF